jgi:uncharacterized small protein (DUF1192 family)
MATQADLDRLVRARNSGALRVSYEGKSIEYRSIAELEKAIAAVQAELDAASAEPSARQVRFYTDKGL